MFRSGADPLELLREGVEALASEDRREWNGAARSDRLLEILGSLDRLHAEALRAIGEWDARQDWLADGALSAPSWLAQRAAVAKSRANQLVRAARLAFRHERTGKALAAGDVSAAQVEVLALAAKGRERLYARDEDVLLDIAPTLSVDDFTTAAKYWRAAADDELAQRDAHLAFQERGLSFATTLHGRVDLRGSFDAEGGAIVMRAIDAYDRPDPSVIDGGPVDGPRSVAQRAHDALVQICSEALARKEAGGHHTTGIDGLIDVERFAGAGPVDVLSGRCEISGVGPVPRVVLERLACDSAVGRVVMRGKSEVLDVGRRTRVVSRSLRRAVELRDRHCVFPGCDAPLRWCDVHHLRHWAHGGETSLDNCLLLCRRHHVACHEGGWELARRPDGTIEVARRGFRVRTRVRARAPADAAV
ncbi:MAG TPA: DUF222 domain-containing protein [Acidimicrobiia bacterium]|nr:DUF222 domain-containing protein [Acidimicrobiia bacterium]